MATVKVYGTQACPWCHRAKAYLKSKNVDFQDIDVSTDYEAAMTMVQASGQQGVPQIWIDDSIIIGFNQEKIDELLGL